MGLKMLMVYTQLKSKDRVFKVLENIFLISSLQHGSLERDENTFEILI